jgi:ribosome biogenesis GTPase A
MNALLKRRVAKVGDEPAVTKTQQKIYLDMNTAIIDTPGLLWPKIEMPSDGLALAASHAIGANALIEEEVAEWLAAELLKRYPQLLAARYGFKLEGMDAIAIVEGIAQKRGYRIRGGDWDYEKASHMLLQDYRSGALGRISLETPETRAAALAVFAEAERIKAEAAAAKAAEKEAERMRGKRGT